MFRARSIHASLGGSLLLGALLLVSASSASANEQLTVQLRDACDPVSFNAATRRRWRCPATAKQDGPPRALPAGAPGEQQAQMVAPARV
jgi:hypothetical protein